MRTGQYWTYEKETLLKEFEVTEQGLSDAQVQKIRSEKGENVLKGGRKKSVAAVFFSQFEDLLVVILIAAAVISMFSGNAESTLVILFVLVMNAILGTVQHVKAEKSLDSLRQLSLPSAKVMRNGTKTEVAAREIVPGDIVLLETGDMIVADGYILHNYSLQVNESTLTGESTNVEKCECILEEVTAVADRRNMVYSGSLVTYGRAEVLVVKTGMDTELGRIAELMNAAKERRTPLQESLDKFSRKLAILIMFVCAIVFGLCLYRRMPLLDAMMFAVALAVAAIPEALGSIVTIVQAFGMQKMAKENAIIKELKAVESLGCVSVICSDKTGTLTQNRMTVQQIYVDGKVAEADELDMDSPAVRFLLYNAVLNNDSSIVDGRGIGDPTEYALLEMAGKLSCSETEHSTDGKIDFHKLRTQNPVLEELPFDSDRKLMSSKIRLMGVETLLTKGAVDVLLDRCENICFADKVYEMTDQWKKMVLEQNRRFSEQGLRVLALAYKECIHPLSISSEYGLTFLGLVSMIDPPRKESAKAVADATRAGIRPVMITGDHKLTAVAIARQIGIFKDGDLAITGMQLDQMPEEQFEKQIEKIRVYARVSPENKLRIVDTWQKKGHIVAMTGDGVNDAPALKKADIGVAMGITGTEVSKDAASMILSDDNFATIIKAVTNGRNVFRNISNAILFLLSGNTAGILAVLYTSLLGLSVPFAPVHLLFINLLTDSLPALAIGMEPADENLLELSPRDPKKGIMTRDFAIRMLLQGILIAIATMEAYHIGFRESEAVASTMAFATLALARLFHGFNCRSSASILTIGLTSNKYSLYAFVSGTILLLLVLCVPELHSLFTIAELTGVHMAQILGMAFLPTLVIQIGKVFAGNKVKR